MKTLSEKDRLRAYAAAIKNAKNQKDVLAAAVVGATLAYGAFKWGNTPGCYAAENAVRTFTSEKRAETFARKNGLVVRNITTFNISG